MEDLLHTMDRCAELAAGHTCTDECIQAKLANSNALYAQGEPPAGYWEKFGKLAAARGYTLKHSTLPRDMFGPGCDGMTVGTTGGTDLARYYRAIGLDPFGIYVVPELAPATEFAVLAHESTHMLLRHSAETPAELEAAQQDTARRAVAGSKPESFDHETQAHLSACAVSRKAGLQLRQSSICYLSDRIHGHGRLIGNSEKHAALLAARQIAAVV